MLGPAPSGAVLRLRRGAAAAVRLQPRRRMSMEPESAVSAVDGASAGWEDGDDDECGAAVRALLAARRAQPGAWSPAGAPPGSEELPLIWLAEREEVRRKARAGAPLSTRDPGQDTEAAGASRPLELKRQVSGLKTEGHGEGEGRKLPEGVVEWMEVDSLSEEVKRKRKKIGEQQSLDHQPVHGWFARWSKSKGTESGRHSISVQCPEAKLEFVVGKMGASLREIMHSVGDGIHIWCNASSTQEQERDRVSWFGIKKGKDVDIVVTCDTQKGCELAESMIRRKIVKGDLGHDTRWSATVPTPQHVVSTVVGKDGTSIRKIAQEVAWDGAQICYNANDVCFEVTSSSQKGCDRAKSLLQEAIELARRPSVMIPVANDNPAKGLVIGKSGDSLWKIVNAVGDGTHISYNRKDGFFEIACDTEDSCAYAKLLMEDAIKEAIREVVTRPSLGSDLLEAWEANLVALAERFGTALSADATELVHRERARRGILTVHRANLTRSRQRARDAAVQAEEDRKQQEADARRARDEEAAERASERFRRVKAAQIRSGAGFAAAAAEAAGARDRYGSGVAAGREADKRLREEVVQLAGRRSAWLGLVAWYRKRGEGAQARADPGTTESDPPILVHVQPGGQGAVHVAIPGVSKLDRARTAAQLTDHFSFYGAVASMELRAVLVRRPDGTTGEPEGRAAIQYHDPAAAAEAAQDASQTLGDAVGERGRRRRRQQRGVAAASASQRGDAPAGGSGGGDPRRSAWRGVVAWAALTRRAAVDGPPRIAAGTPEHDERRARRRDAANVPPEQRQEGDEGGEEDGEEEDTLSDAAVMMLREMLDHTSREREVRKADAVAEEVEEEWKSSVPDDSVEALMAHPSAVLKQMKEEVEARVAEALALWKQAAEKLERVTADSSSYSEQKMLQRGADRAQRLLHKAEDYRLNYLEARQLQHASKQVQKTYGMSRKKLTAKVERLQAELKDAEDKGESALECMALKENVKEARRDYHQAEQAYQEQHTSLHAQAEEARKLLRAKRERDAVKKLAAAAAEAGSDQRQWREERERQRERVRGRIDADTERELEEGRRQQQAREGRQMGGADWELGHAMAEFGEAGARVREAEGAAMEEERERLREAERACRLLQASAVLERRRNLEWELAAAARLMTERVEQRHPDADDAVQELEAQRAEQWVKDMHAKVEEERKLQEAEQEARAERVAEATRAVRREQAAALEARARAAAERDEAARLRSERHAERAARAKAEAGQMRARQARAQAILAQREEEARERAARAREEEDRERARALHQFEAATARLQEAEARLQAAAEGEESAREKLGAEVAKARDLLDQAEEVYRPLETAQLMREAEEREEAERREAEKMSLPGEQEPCPPASPPLATAQSASDEWESSGDGNDGGPTDDDAYRHQILRIDVIDGRGYTREEFIEHYGGTQEWNRAAPAVGPEGERPWAEADDEGADVAEAPEAAEASEVAEAPGAEDAPEAAEEPEATEEEKATAAEAAEEAKRREAKRQADLAAAQF